MVGILVVFALLVLPPIGGLLLGRRLPSVFVISILIAVLSVFSGLLVSYRADLPSGATIVVTMGAGVLLTRLFRRTHARTAASADLKCTAPKTIISAGRSLKPRMHPF